MAISILPLQKLSIFLGGAKRRGNLLTMRVLVLYLVIRPGTAGVRAKLHPERSRRAEFSFFSLFFNFFNFTINILPLRFAIKVRGEVLNMEY